MKLDMETAKAMMEKSGGSLFLRGTGITELPEGLTVGGSLDLMWTGITALPRGLTVAYTLNMRGTGITSLPEDLLVGLDLDLRASAITSLPKGLVVGGWIWLNGTGVTELPEDLKVGGCIDVRGTLITKGDVSRVQWLRYGDYDPGRYVYTNELTLVKRREIIDGYTYYVGEFPDRNVVSDGRNYVQCENFQEGIQLLKEMS